MTTAELLGIDAMSVEQTEELLKQITQRLYQEHRSFQPRYPWIMVRTLAREQQTQSGLILPEIDQNKTIHEGIVVATWKPFTQQLGTRVPGKTDTRRLVYKKSQFSLGDHVLFPHWTGLPVRGFPEDKYRIIKEEGYEHNGGAYAQVEYSSLQQSAETKLRTLCERYSGIGLAKDLAKTIEEQFLLVDRDGRSVTLSGR